MLTDGVVRGFVGQTAFADPWLARNSEQSSLTR